MNATEEKIVQAALREFAEFGFAGARMDRIAKNAKVNKAMIYYHYKDKEELYESILLFHAERMSGFIEKYITDGKSDINMLYSFISDFIDFFDSLEQDSIRFLLREISSGGKYLKKIIFPKIIKPLSFLLSGNLLKGISDRSFRPVDPYYTLIHLIGGIIYFYVVKMGIKGTELYDIVYSGDYLEKFKANLIEVIKHGIETKEGGQ